MVTHTIRHKDGNTVEVNLTEKRAIKAFCTECMGWQTNPEECTSKLCPLYKFRGSFSKSKSRKKELTEEQRLVLRQRALKMLAKKNLTTN